jgi:two-component system, NtrC family, sensor kinase
MAARKKASFIEERSNVGLAAGPALATLDDSKREEADETMEMLSGNLDKIVEHGQRADNIVKSMLEHSRGVSGERREVDLNNLIGGR